MSELKKLERQQEVLTYQQEVKQEQREQQLQQIPVQQEDQQEVQEPIQQLRLMETAAPDLLVHPAESAFEELTSGYHQKNREANKSKRNRKRHSEDIQKHDIQVCDERFMQRVQASQTKDIVDLQEAQFHSQVQQDLNIEQNKYHTPEEIEEMREQLASYELIRKDVTGHNRRSRAKTYKENIPKGKKPQVDEDVTNLVHNYHVDLYLTTEYKPCEVVSKFYDAYKASKLITEEDMRLQVPIKAIEKKANGVKDQKILNKYKAEKAPHKAKLNKFSEMVLYIKGVAGQLGMRVEALRVKLTAMNKALKQLEFEQQDLNSVYTEAMIQNLKERISPLEEEIKEELEQFTNPTFDESILKPEELKKKKETFQPMLARIFELTDAYREKERSIADGTDPGEAETIYENKVRNLLQDYSETP